MGPVSELAVAGRVAGASALLGCGYLMGLSISATPDTPCGSILAPNFGWSMSSQCGVVHVGTAVASGLLFVVGPALLVASHRALIISQAMAAIAVVAVVALSWRASTYDEPVVRRGWDSLRTLSLTVAGASIAAAVLILLARHWRGRPNHRPATRRPTP